MKRIDARLNINGTQFTIQAATPQVFADWVHSLLVEIEWFPSTLFRVESLAVMDVPQ